MNVRISINRKRAKCRHCSQMIESGEYQVVCTYYMHPPNSGKSWLKTMYFHAKDPYCWVDRGILSVSMRPHTETRGRKAVSMPDAVKVERVKILRRRAAVMQRVDFEMRHKRRPEKLLHLAESLEKFKQLIESYGGVPKRW